ncbi:transposase [Desulfurobacterium sp.]|uniref:transposase n=1 Tax=Desulfurobacterium sp. TaxID=2004706 RepID=UPI00260F5C30|nr:transposase [Desulfurobacterium sp.]
METFELTEKVLGIDLAPGIKRLGVAVIHDGASHSVPVFFKAERLVRKVMRIQKEIDRLEHKIDEAYIRKDFDRIPHLVAEQRRRRNKTRNLRKQILETFVNEVILVAITNDCNVIVIENLSGIKVPEWRNKALRFLFSQWFYSRFEAKLRQKAKLHGIKVMSIKPYGTSVYCSTCGNKLSGKGLHLECKTCKKTWDRDYNAAVNVAVKGFKITTGRGQAEGQCSEAVRLNEPLRLTPRPTVEVEKADCSYHADCLSQSGKGFHTCSSD